MLMQWRNPVCRQSVLWWSCSLYPLRSFSRIPWTERCFGIHSHFETNYTTYNTQNYTFACSFSLCGTSLWQKNRDLVCLRTMSIIFGEMWKKAGWKWLMSSFITCAFHQTVLGKSNWGGKHWMGMWHTCGTHQLKNLKESDHFAHLIIGER